MEFDKNKCTRTITKFEEMKEKLNNEFYNCKDIPCTLHGMHWSEEYQQVRILKKYLVEILDILDSACK